MAERNVLPTGDGPKSPWSQRHFWRSVRVVALGLSVVGIGAWLKVRWVGATGIIVGLLGLIGLLHVQIEWAQNVAESFRAPSAPKAGAVKQRIREAGDGARRPNDR